jgi:hypothetical protein
VDARECNTCFCFSRPHRVESRFPVGKGTWKSSSIYLSCHTTCKTCLLRLVLGRCWRLPKFDGMNYSSSIAQRLMVIMIRYLLNRTLGHYLSWHDTPYIQRHAQVISKQQDPIYLKTHCRFSVFTALVSSGTAKIHIPSMHLRGLQIQTASKLFGGLRPLHDATYWPSSLLRVPPFSCTNFLQKKPMTRFARGKLRVWRGIRLQRAKYLKRMHKAIPMQLLTSMMIQG